MTSCGVRGSGPRAMWRLSSLRRLALAKNALTSLPADFGKRVPALTSLDVSGNPKLAEIPESIGDVATTLAELDAWRARGSRILPSVSASARRSSASIFRGTRFPDFRRRTEISRDSNVSTRERARFASCRRSFAASVRSARWISPGTKSTPRRRRSRRPPKLERLDLRVNPIASLPAEFARLRERLGAKHAMWSPNVTIRAPIVTDADALPRAPSPFGSRGTMGGIRGPRVVARRVDARRRARRRTRPLRASGRGASRTRAGGDRKTHRAQDASSAKESSRGVVPEIGALTELETLDASENAPRGDSGGVAALRQRARRRRLEKQTRRAARVGSPAQHRTFGRVREQVGARAARIRVGIGRGASRDAHPTE